MGRLALGQARLVVWPLLFAALLGQRAARAAPGEVVKEQQHIAEPLDFDRLGTAEGLQNSDVQAIVQDALGFLWFGTEDGLTRYDGTKLKVYRPIEGDNASLTAGYITALALDKAGKLWVGTDKGVNLYDPGTDKFTRYVHGNGAHSLSSDGVVGILRDHKDRIWFAMAGGGLDRFDEKNSGFEEHLGAPLDTNIISLAEDKQGNLWLGTNEEGVIRWNPDDNSSAKFKPAFDEGATKINAVLAASTGKVWLATEGSGLFVFDPATKRFLQYRHDPTNHDSLADDHVQALYEDKTSSLWIATRNGLNRLDPAGKLVTYEHDQNNPKSIVYPWITVLYQDAGGVLWAGGKAGGLSKFEPLRMKFGHYRMRTDTANSFYEDTDGTLWIGTYHGGLYKYEWGQGRVTTYHTLGAAEKEGSVQLDLGWLTKVYRDRRGTLWIASLELGLLEFDSENETFRQYKPDPSRPGGMPNNDGIWDIWEDDKGSLWLATFGAGLVKFDPRSGKFAATTVDNGTGLSSNFLYRLYPDPKDAKILWIGTAKGGLVRFDTASGTGTSWHHRGDDPASLSSDDVVSIYREPSGGVWVGTYGGGLNHLDPTSGKVERFTTSNSALPSDVVWGVLAGDDGRLWLSTNGGGLVVLDPKDKKIFTYESSDGVQDNEFGQGSFMKSARTGKLYFGGVGGFNVFSSKDITRDSYVPPVVLTGLKVFNQDVKLASPIWMLPPLELSYSDSFELQFAALSFAAPAKNRYAYKLEGFDDKFIETDRPYATYTKLDGGNYTLRVRAANEHGTWNETGLALKLAVTPPWWRTWPAFALYLLLLVGAVFLVFRYQRQKLKRLEREGRLAVVERDLELTGAVQSGFLPNYNEFHGARVQLFGFYRAADACSGDWWWHESLSDGRHVVLVGDVTGHGPGPAMVTAAVATAFHVLAGSGPFDVQQTLELLNRVVLQVAKGKYHMTMAALELDESTGLYTFHNAGAPPILSLNSTGKHRVHFCAGTPLGTETEFEVGRVEGRLEPSERIMMYTDGIPEIALPNGNVLGIRRFAQMYERTRSQPLNDAAFALAQLADQTQSGTPQADDWTFTLIEWR